MSHGGNPEAGTNPWIGTDGTSLAIASPSGPDTWVVPVNDNFTVAMTWELTGNLAVWLSKFKFDYTVTYTFAGLGNADGPQLSVTHKTVPGQTVYGAPATTVIVPAHSLPVGKYEVLATVTFENNPPISAYIEIPVLDVYQD